MRSVACHDPPDHTVTTTHPSHKCRLARLSWPVARLCGVELDEHQHLDVQSDLCTHITMAAHQRPGHIQLGLFSTGHPVLI